MLLPFVFLLGVASDSIAQTNSPPLVDGGSETVNVTSARADQSSRQRSPRSSSSSLVTEYELLLSSGREGTLESGDYPIEISGYFLGFTGAALLRPASWIAGGIEATYTFTPPSPILIGHLISIPIVLRPTLPLSDSGELFLQGGIGPIFGWLVPKAESVGSPAGASGYSVELLAGYRAFGSGRWRMVFQGGGRSDWLTLGEGYKTWTWATPLDGSGLLHVQVFGRVGVSWR